MKNKGTKRKAEQKQHESTKVVRRKTKHSKPQLEPEFFRDQRELEDLWKHAYPVGTELDRLDRLYEYNWNFSNLEVSYYLLFALFLKFHVYVVSSKIVNKFLRKFIRSIRKHLMKAVYYTGRKFISLFARREDLWKHAYPVATELDRLDRLYEYNWNFSNLEEAFDEGGVLHGEKVYLFVCTEAPIERADTLIPTVIAVSKSNFFEVTLKVIFLSGLIICTIEQTVSPFPPSDKIGLISVQRESESRKVVDMKQMKMDWVPYVPLGQRSALVERLKSQIFVLSCVQRRAGLKLLKDERVAEFTYCIPYFYNPFEEDETKESTIVELLYPVEPPVYCEFDWEFDEVEEYTNNLIAAEELSEDQKEAFKEFLKEKVQERKRANREARQKRKQALEELSQEKFD
ncbi:heat intolerant 4-like protein [Tanacetum coccineum]|uniref:Heat intolerant 4-like protein n=1 Tax=Tanacetum coccineum TaxID=301880 RepID=A0ABQ4ZXQ7_9ASTR